MSGSNSFSARVPSQNLADYPLENAGPKPTLTFTFNPKPPTVPSYPHNPKPYPYPIINSYPSLRVSSLMTRFLTLKLFQRLRRSLFATAGVGGLPRLIHPRLSYPMWEWQRSSLLTPSPSPSPLPNLTATLTFTLPSPSPDLTFPFFLLVVTTLLILLTLTLLEGLGRNRPVYLPSKGRLCLGAELFKGFRGDSAPRSSIPLRARYYSVCLFPSRGRKG